MVARLFKVGLSQCCVLSNGRALHFLDFLGGYSHCSRVELGLAGCMGAIALLAAHFVDICTQNRCHSCCHPCSVCQHTAY